MPAGHARDGARLRAEGLIADEPTTALEVTVQRQVLELLSRLQEEMGLGVLLITHELGVVAEMCDSLLVMCAGQIVERGRTEVERGRTEEAFMQPDTALLAAAGARTDNHGAVIVDDTMATSLPGVRAAGDCVVTLHRQLGVTCLPLGTTAHKQGRVAGANAVGGTARFRGSLGTQVVKVFELVVARTGLRDTEAASIGLDPVTVHSSPDDHKAYYPTAHPIDIRITGDATTGSLLGAQLVGRLGTEVAKRVDTDATALFHRMTVAEISDLDLSYAPPLGSPWDAVQIAAQSWETHFSPAPAPTRII